MLLYLLEFLNRAILHNSATASSLDVILYYMIYNTVISLFAISLVMFSENILKESFIIFDNKYKQYQHFIFYISLAIFFHIQR